MASSPFLSSPREKSTQKSDLSTQQQSADRAVEKEAALYDMFCQILKSQIVHTAICEARGLSQQTNDGHWRK